MSKSLIAKFNKDSHLTRIKASYIDDSVKLTDFEEKLLEKLRFIFSLRHKNKYSKQQTIDKSIEEYNIGQATAYRYYAMSTHVFGELDEVDAKAERVIIAEQYWFLYQMQIKERNWSEAKKTLDSYNDVIPKVDFSEIDPDKIKSNNYRISISREFLTIMKERSQSGVVDMNMTAEDIDFQDI